MKGAQGIQAVKKYLEAYRMADLDLDMQVERLNRLETKMYSAGSPVYTDMPKSPTHFPDKIDRLVTQKMELVKQIKEAEARQTESRKIIEQMIAGISPTEKAVIRMRYIDGERWETVAYQIYGDREDYNDRADSYYRRTTRLHGSALINIANSKDA